MTPATRARLIADLPRNLGAMPMLEEHELTAAATYDDTRHTSDPDLGDFGEGGAVTLRSLCIAGMDVPASDLPAALVHQIETFIGENA